MQKIILSIVIASFLYIGNSFADVYVITAPDKTIYSLSEQDDAVVPPGYVKDIIKGKDIKSLMLGEDLSLYSYNGKKFTLDDKKVAKKNKDLMDASVSRENKRNAKASAIEKLKVLGLTDFEIEAFMERK